MNPSQFDIGDLSDTKTIQPPENRDFEELLRVCKQKSFHFLAIQEGLTECRRDDQQVTDHKLALILVAAA